MGAQHSEGPWFVRKSPHYKFEHYTHREIIIDPEGEEGGIVLGEVFYSDTGDNEAEANARLIAAAPDLLAALVEILGPLNVCSDNANVRDETMLPIDITMGEIRRARAAIAKATQP